MKLQCFYFQVFYSKLRVAVIGQSTFASEVYKCLRNQGHEVVGVFTIADTGSRADPLGKLVIHKVYQILCLI